MLSTLYRLLQQKWTGLSYKAERVESNAVVVSAKMNASKRKDSSEVIKNYHKQAFDCISKALRIDEDDRGLFGVLCVVWQAGWHNVALVTPRSPFPMTQAKRNRRSTGTRKESLNLKRVLQWSSRYKVIGLHGLHYAVAQYSWHVRRHPFVLAGDQYERAERLQKKMIANLAMAQDRLALLGLLSENLKHITSLPPLLLACRHWWYVYFCLFSAEATLESERASSPPQTSNHSLSQPKPAPKCQPTVRPSTNVRPPSAARPPYRPPDQKVTLLSIYEPRSVFF